MARVVDEDGQLQRAAAISGGQRLAELEVERDARQGLGEREALLALSGAVNRSRGGTSGVQPAR